MPGFRFLVSSSAAPMWSGESGSGPFEFHHLNAHNSLYNPGALELIQGTGWRIEAIHPERYIQHHIVARPI